jgi:anhydro-N-acetylmuramic acid kinase
MKTHTEGLYIGLMSGTSLDGIDVALAEYGGDAERPEPARLVAFESYTYEATFRDRLRGVIEGGNPAGVCDLNFALGERLAVAVSDTLIAAGVAARDVAAIGSHGQTVWHSPPAPGARGATLQLGEPAVIAERTGIPVVADFRVRDVAAGGQGAPLSPYFDRLLLSGDEARAIVNLGGMGNLTALPATGSDDTPVAFDTGPGVALIDGAVHHLTGGHQAFDAEGRLAAAGRVLGPDLESWLSDPFFSEPPPRSTGRERFGGAALTGWLAGASGAPAEDLIATLTEVTAASVQRAFEWIPFDIDAVYLCGGGGRNPELVRRISADLDPTPVRSVDELGWDGDAREAAAFALFARQHMLGLPLDLGWATGAEGPRILGKRVPV